MPGVGKFTFPFVAGGEIFGWKSPDILGRIADWEESRWVPISDMASLLRGLVLQVSLATIVALLVVPLTAWVIWRTRFGLRVRICGEHPHGGESQGIDIYRYKYFAVIISGALAGLGGAFIASPELSGIYLEGQTNGRGFIGLAALIFGNWRPVGVMAGAMLFGYPFGLGLRDLGGAGSHSLLLVNTIALALVLVWSLGGRKDDDAHEAGEAVADPVDDGDRAE